MKTMALNLFSLLAASCVLACAGGPGADEQLDEASQAVVGVDSFLYFRSNATAWGVDETTRLFQFAPNVFARTYSTTQPWMITNGDSAILTETNQLDGWGTLQTYSGAASKHMLVPATDTLVAQAPGGDAQFTVKYASLGEQRVLVNLNPTPPTITIQARGDVCSGVSCPSGLHCALLEPTGIPTCIQDNPSLP